MIQRMENGLAQLKTEKEKAEQPGGDKSQTKNEHTPPPPQADAVPPKEPLILLDSKIPSCPAVPHFSTPGVSDSEGLWLAPATSAFASQFERIALTTNLGNLRIFGCVKFVKRPQAPSLLPAGKPRTKVLFAYLK